MKVEQLYTNCLAQGAYYIESKGEAAIIDPLRETQPYIDLAEERGAKIKYILETHFHADFVSGHIDLAAKTGATIVYGPNAEPDYEVHVAKDGEELPLGDLKIKVLHTPGHTMESSTFLLLDEDGEEQAIFTGDTLFIGDVGRPDLAVKTDLSREDLAAHLYDSLRNKIMPLPDEVVVYPGHGAGSACGKNMSKETTDTLGNQKESNYALRKDMSKEEFIKEVTEGLATPPQYFPKNAVMNKKGYKSIDEVMGAGMNALAPAEFDKKRQEDGVVVLDTRDAQDFKDDFIPDSINIGLGGMFAVWVGTIITDLNSPILIVAEEGKEEEAVMRLARVGYDNVVGYLKGGISAWKKAGYDSDNLTSIPATEFKEKVEKGEVHVVDVRRPAEYTSEHMEEAVNVPLDYLEDYLHKIDDKDQTYYVHCAGGYRSMIASSLLKQRGYDKVIDVAGGFKAIKEAGIKVTDYVCPTTVEEA